MAYYEMVFGGEMMATELFDKKKVVKIDPLVGTRWGIRPKYEIIKLVSPSR